MTTYSHNSNLNTPSTIGTYIEDGITYNKYIVTIDGVTYTLNFMDIILHPMLKDRIDEFVFEIVKNSKEMKRREIEKGYNNFQDLIHTKLPSVFNDYRS